MPEARDRKQATNPLSIFLNTILDGVNSGFSWIFSPITPIFNFMFSANTPEVAVNASKQAPAADARAVAERAVASLLAALGTEPLATAERTAELIAVLGSERAVASLLAALAAEPLAAAELADALAAEPLAAAELVAELVADALAVDERAAAKLLATTEQAVACLLAALAIAEGLETQAAALGAKRATASLLASLATVLGTEPLATAKRAASLLASVVSVLFEEPLTTERVVASIRVSIDTVLFKEPLDTSDQALELLASLATAAKVDRTSIPTNLRTEIERAVTELLAEPLATAERVADPNSLAATEQAVACLLASLAIAQGLEPQAAALGAKRATASLLASLAAVLGTEPLATAKRAASLLTSLVAVLFEEPLTTERVVASIRVSIDSVLFKERLETSNMAFELIASLAAATKVDFTPIPANLRTQLERTVAELVADAQPAANKRAAANALFIDHAPAIISQESNDVAAVPRIMPCQSFLSSVSSYGLWAASAAAAAGLSYAYFSINKNNL